MVRGLFRGLRLVDSFLRKRLMSMIGESQSVITVTEIKEITECS